MTSFVLWFDGERVRLVMPRFFEFAHDLAVACQLRVSDVQLIDSRTSFDRAIFVFFPDHDFRLWLMCLAFAR